jgi:hypothetical protein
MVLAGWRRGWIAVPLLLFTLTACSINPAPTASVSPTPRASAVPTISGAPSPAPMSIAAANAEIRSTVSGAHPVLLPGAISSSWSAVLTMLTPAFFDIIYTSSDDRQTVELAIVVPNPPPPGQNGSQSHPHFHGDIHSLYQINDKTQPTSDRWLMWNEPGRWTEPNGSPGVPYFLTAKGLPDVQFWAVANSLR